MHSHLLQLVEKAFLITSELDSMPLHISFLYAPYLFSQANGITTDAKYEFIRNLRVRIILFSKSVLVRVPKIVYIPTLPVHER